MRQIGTNLFAQPPREILGLRSNGEIRHRNPRLMAAGACFESKTGHGHQCVKSYSRGIVELNRRDLVASRADDDVLLAVLQIRYKQRKR